MRSRPEEFDTSAVTDDGDGGDDDDDDGDDDNDVNNIDFTQATTASVSASETDRLILNDPPVPLNYTITAVPLGVPSMHAIRFGYFRKLTTQVRNPNTGNDVNIIYVQCRVPGCPDPLMSTVRDNRMLLHLKSRHLTYYNNYRLQCVRINIGYKTPKRKSSDSSTTSNSDDGRTPLTQHSKRRPPPSAVRSVSTTSISSMSSSTANNDAKADDWRAECQQLWALCFASNSIAHRVVETPSFQRAVMCQSRSGEYTPEWEPPTLNRVIIKEYQQHSAARLRHMVIQRLQGRVVTLALDGWTDRNATKVINVMLLTRGEAYYWKGVFCEEEYLGAPIVAPKIVQILDALIEKGVVVAAICTDNEEVNIAMHTLIIQTTYSCENNQHSVTPYRHLIHLRDGSHTVNLTVKAILSEPVALQIMKDLSATIAVFKSSKKLRARLKANQTERGQLRLLEWIDTRWNSQYTALERFVALRVPLTSTLNADVESPDCENRHLVHTDDWWQTAQELMNLLIPFVSAINNLQSDDVSLHTYNTVIERCREMIITAAEKLPETALTAAANRGVAKYNSVRWKPLNDKPQARQFVRMLMLHLKHGLAGSPRIEWIKPFSMFRVSRSNASAAARQRQAAEDAVYHAHDNTDEYVPDVDNAQERNQAAADNLFDERMSKRIVDWFKTWAAEMLINTKDSCLGNDFILSTTSVSALREKIYLQWLSFVSRTQDIWRNVYVIFHSHLESLRKQTTPPVASPNRTSADGDTFEEQAAIFALSSIQHQVEFAISCKVLLQVVPSEAAVTDGHWYWI